VAASPTDGTRAGSSGGPGDRHDDATVPWASLLAETERRLSAAGLPAAGVEARRIVEEASGYGAAELVVALDEPARRRPVAHLDAMVERRLAGEPLQYVLGSWGFRTLDLMVDRRVLIPRPETEVVAGIALDELDRLRGAEPDRRLRAADLGTGSGAIALSLAAERGGVEIWGTDASADALEVASANLAGLGLRGRSVQLRQGSWFDALPPELAGRLDLLVSNPPYVAETDRLPPEVAGWEPAQALVSGPTGLEALEVLVAGATAWLRRPGALVVELAPHQAQVVAALARRHGFVDVAVESDLAGRPRALRARVSG
jgi:release factor glutamine methyltransferase